MSFLELWPPGERITYASPAKEVRHQKGSIFSDLQAELRFFKEKAEVSAEPETIYQAVADNITDEIKRKEKILLGDVTL